MTLEQGEQFRAQAIAARCSKGADGEEGDHDFRSSIERRMIAVAMTCHI